MCQVDEEYNGNLESKVPSMLPNKCVKCKDGTPVLVIRAGDAFCRCCFKEYFIHKFRAVLGKNRIIFPGEKLLLAVSGGPASSSMLSQVQEGLSREAPKKLRFVPGIVYIDEGGASGQREGEREKAVAQLESIFRATGYPYYIVHLEQVFHLPCSVLEAVPLAPEKPESSYKAAVDRFIQTNASGSSHGSSIPGCLSHVITKESGESTPFPSPEQRQALATLLASVKTLTAKEDLLQILRHHLILHTARAEGYSKVMVGDSCSRLAIKLLSNMSLGRGASVATDTGFSDARHGDVLVIRPMRDYSSKEIAFYNRMFAVPSVFIPGLDTKARDKGSIQQLTESFVTKLQSDFPSTVSTIYRTSEKLNTTCSLLNTSTEPMAKCLLCFCPLDTKGDEASAYHATLISERLSQGRAPAAAHCCSAQGGHGEEGGCCSTRASVTTTTLRSQLCYSCRLTVKDVAAVDTLPRYIVSVAEQRRRRSQMKEEIGAFLLDEEEEGET